MLNMFKMTVGTMCIYNYKFSFIAISPVKQANTSADRLRMSPIIINQAKKNIKLNDIVMQSFLSIETKCVTCPDIGWVGDNVAM